MSRAWKRRLKRGSRPWVVFWIPYGGRAADRKQESFGDDKAEADRFLADKLVELQQASPVAADRNITVAEFGKQWLLDAGPGLKRTTLDGYQKRLKLYIGPKLGNERLRDIHQQHGVKFLSGMLAEGYAEQTVKSTYQVLRRLFQRAKFEGVVKVNPMTSLWKELPISVQSRREGKTRERDEAKSKAMTPTEAAALMAEEAKTGDVLFTLAYLAGLRIGEALGMQLDDVDIERGEITVRRRLAIPTKGEVLADRIDTPKGGKSRVVDMSPGLVELMRPVVARRRQEVFQAPGSTPWLFIERGTTDTVRSYFAVYQQFKRLQKRADLPLRFSPHSLRHSYATHMLQAGAEVAYVATQIGDRIETLLAWYWWALPAGNKSRAALIDTAGKDLGAAAGAVATLTGTDPSGMGGKQFSTISVENLAGGENGEPDSRKGPFTGDSNRGGGA